MKRMMALITLAGMVIVGCAHKEKPVGGSSDESMSTSSTGTSNPSKNYSDTNGNLSNPSSDGSKPVQQ